MAETVTMPAGQMFRTLGTCGKCGGPVMHALHEPRARAHCQDCGARLLVSHGPLLPMAEGDNAYLAAPIRKSDAL